MPRTEIIKARGTATIPKQRAVAFFAEGKGHFNLAGEEAEKVKPAALDALCWIVHRIAHDTSQNGSSRIIYLRDKILKPTIEAVCNKFKEFEFADFDLSLVVVLDRLVLSVKIGEAGVALASKGCVRSMFSKPKPSNRNKLKFAFEIIKASSVNHRVVLFDGSDFVAELACQNDVFLLSPSSFSFTSLKTLLMQKAELLKDGAGVVWFDPVAEEGSNARVAMAAKHAEQEVANNLLKELQQQLVSRLLQETFREFFHASLNLLKFDGVRSVNLNFIAKIIQQYRDAADAEKDLMTLCLAEYFYLPKALINYLLIKQLDVGPLSKTGFKYEVARWYYTSAVKEEQQQCQRWLLLNGEDLSSVDSNKIKLKKQQTEDALIPLKDFLDYFGADVSVAQLILWWRVVQQPISQLVTTFAELQVLFDIAVKSEHAEQTLRSLFQVGEVSSTDLTELIEKQLSAAILARRCLPQLFTCFELIKWLNCEDQGRSAKLAELASSLDQQTRPRGISSCVACCFGAADSTPWQDAVNPLIAAEATAAQPVAVAAAT